MKRTLLWVWSSGMAIWLTASISARANYIREENGVLTTDLPGLNITQDLFALQYLNRETWQINADPAVWDRFGLDSVVFSEPGSDTLFNFVVRETSPHADGRVLHLYSDVTYQRFESELGGFPSGPPPNTDGHMLWHRADGTAVDVIFEDIGTSEPVPDGGGSWALLLGGLSCVGLARRWKSHA